MNTKNKKLIFGIILTVTLALSSFLTIIAYINVVESKNPEHKMIEEIFDDEHIKALKGSYLKYKSVYTYDDGTTRESTWNNRITEYN